MPSARFITFEGGEGAGKSTQIKLLGQALSAAGIAHHLTREPGGSEGAEAIRSLIVSGDAARWDAPTETLLLMAARADHVAKTIRPKLAAGEWVVSDRFFDSTLVYQGIAKGLGMAWIKQLHTLLFGNLAPDLTLILDIDPKLGLSRASKRTHNETRFEGMEISFHQRLRDGFHAIASAEPARCKIVDASADVASVHQAIIDTTNKQFQLNLKPVAGL